MKMSEKVILTKKQAEAIEIFKNDARDTLEYIAKRKIENNPPFKHCYKPFNDMTIDDIALAAFSGYEIEQSKFEVGDVVVGLKSGSLFKITGEIGKNFYGTRLKDGEPNFLLDSEMIRHATKEEIFWAELGREVGEFREGDITLTIHSTEYRIDSKDTILDEKDEYSKGKLKGFYPTESFKLFLKE